MGTKPGKLIGIKLPFHMNHFSICETIMAAFMSDVIYVKTAFQSVLSNHIVTEHPELRFGVQFRIMDDPLCNDSTVI